MSNEKEMSAVEWYIDELEKYEKGISEYFSIHAIQNHARRMEKQQTRDDIKNELKLIGNYFDVGQLDQREQRHHIRFTSILKDRFDFYNETNGGNK